MADTRRNMALQDLAPELLIRIFESLSTVSDIVNLSLTCRYLSAILPSSQKLTIFYRALDETDGPVEEIIQLLTQNQNQSVHIRRTPPLSLALLSQVTAVARVARRYVDLYPRFRWPEGESAHRRLLSPHEARRLRRAVYRMWSYVKAFHQFSYRVETIESMVKEERLKLLRSWSNDELLELENLRGLMEQLLATEICPTDGEVYSRIPEDAQQFHLSLRYPHRRPVSVIPSGYHDLFYSSHLSETGLNKQSVQELRLRHMQGWGSEMQNFYFIQSFLKLSPAQILWLYDNAVSRADVEGFIEQQTHDRCFFESGSLLFHDWVTLLHARNVDVQQAREAVWSGNAGIVIEQEGGSGGGH
jgi:hypothetical protein